MEKEIVSNLGEGPNGAAIGPDGFVIFVTMVGLIGKSQ